MNCNHLQMLIRVVGCRLFRHMMCFPSKTLNKSLSRSALLALLRATLPYVVADIRTKRFWLFQCVWDSSGSAVLKLNGIACVLLRMAVDSSKKSEAQPTRIDHLSSLMCHDLKLQCLVSPVHCSNAPIYIQCPTAPTVLR